MRGFVNELGGNFLGHKQALFSRNAVQPCRHCRLFITSPMAVYGVYPRDRSRSRSQERKETSLASMHAFTHTQTPLEPIYSHLESLHVFAFLVMRGKRLTRTCSPDSSPMCSLPHRPSQSQYRVHKKNDTHLHVLGWQFVGSSSLLAHSLRWHTNKSHPHAPRISSISLFDTFRSKEFPTQPGSIVRPRNLGKSHPWLRVSPVEFASLVREIHLAGPFLYVSISHRQVLEQPISVSFRKHSLPFLDFSDFRTWQSFASPRVEAVSE